MILLNPFASRSLILVMEIVGPVLSSDPSSGSLNAGPVPPSSGPRARCKSDRSRADLWRDRGATGIINIWKAELFVPAPPPGRHTTRDPA